MAPFWNSFWPVGAVALLLPVLIFIATASRLSAARREERFAAMRLVGATPHQVSVVSAVEAAVAGIAGVAVGFGLFFLLQPLLYRVPFIGAPLAPGDLSLSWLDVAFVVIGVPIAAVVSARIALRRVQVSPLGVKRRAASDPPQDRYGSFRCSPASPSWPTSTRPENRLATEPRSSNCSSASSCCSWDWFLPGRGSRRPDRRIMTARANRPSTLIAGRRLLDNPKAAFRFVSGLVIALFVATAAIGALSSIAAATSIGGGSAGKDTLAELFCSFSTTNCPASTQVPSVSTSVLAELRATPGVRGVTLVHQSPSMAQQDGHSFGVVACDQLAKTPAIGRCAPGTNVVSVGYFLSNLLGHHSQASSTTWPSADLSDAEAALLPVDAVVVATDGSPGSLERARTSRRAVVSVPGHADCRRRVRPVERRASSP